MIELLEKFKTYTEPEEIIESSSLVGEKKSNKILCIIEGQTEFKYISKVFELYGYKKGCFSLSEEHVKVAWGSKFPQSYNLVNTKCSFPGGSCQKGFPVPWPAVKAYEMYKVADGEIPIYDSILVIFDSDKDKDNEVQKYFEKEFKNLNKPKLLLVSTPCFESAMIDFCQCGNCRNEIDSIKLEDKPPCEKYKKKFSSLSCFSKFSNSNCTSEKVTAEGLISYLDLDNINNIETPLKSLHELISNLEINQESD